MKTDDPGTDDVDSQNKYATLPKKLQPESPRQGQHPIASGQTNTPVARRGDLLKRTLSGIQNATTLILGLILLAIAFSYGRSPTIYVRRFAVPRELDAIGLSEQVVSGRVHESIVAIQADSTLGGPLSPLVQDSSGLYSTKVFDKVPLGTLIEIVRKVLHSKSYDVHGAVVRTGSDFTVHVSVNNKPVGDVQLPASTVKRHGLGGPSFDAIASLALRVIDPRTLAASYLARDNWEGVRRLATFARDSLPGGRVVGLNLAGAYAWHVFSAQLTNSDSMARVADSCFKAALELDPQFVPGMVNHAIVLWSKGETDSAFLISSKAQSLTRDLRVDAIWASIALDYEVEHSFREKRAPEKTLVDSARAYLYKSAWVYPASAAPLEQLAALYLATSQIDSARAVAKRALEVARSGDYVPTFYLICVDARAKSTWGQAIERAVTANRLWPRARRIAGVLADLRAKRIPRDC